MVDIGLYEAVRTNFTKGKVMDELENFLTVNKETLKQLANDMDFSVWINNRRGDILFANDSVTDLYGEDPKTLIGHNIISLADNGFVSEQALVETLHTKKIAYRLSMSKTGNKLALSSYPLVDGAGRIKAIIGIGKPVEQAASTVPVEEQKNIITEMDEIQTKDFIVASEQMNVIMESLPRVAKSEATVMILGETGVGKDGIAYQIHKLSPRANAPYIIINCATIPENLIESELFGYEKGAFTNATMSKIGLLEMADHGTIFLDEVGDMPYSVQVKLLRCIQNRQIMRVGGTRMRDLNVRFITATNQPMENLVSAGKFRKDLYYRLNAIKLTIPPLRERFHDILPLVNHFLKIFNKKYKTSKQLSRATLRYLQGYSWPGNVRELENTIEHAVVLCPYAIIGTEFLPDYITEQQRISEKKAACTLKEAVEQCERALLSEAMCKYSSTRKAAEVLGCNQATVVRKLHKYGLI